MERVNKKMRETCERNRYLYRKRELKKIDNGAKGKIEGRNDLERDRNTERGKEGGASQAIK